MTVLHIIKVKVHNCLNEKIRSCKLLVLLDSSIDIRVDLVNFPKIKIAIFW